MTTMSSECFQRHSASSSSIVEADYLRLSVDSVHDLAHLVSKGLQLNERQCQDLLSKIIQTVENIQKLVPPSGVLKVSFGPALKNLFRVLEKAKLLVRQCCHPDWCRAAVFQIHNERAFREVLLEIGLCYNVLYEVTKVIMRDWVWTLIQALDLRQSSLFLPAPETDVLEDQETLKRRLQQVADTADDRNLYLARYLLGKLDCISAAHMHEEFNVPDALLWMNEIKPEGTWKWQRVIGGGSGAACVCCYDWLGIPCARKEFHCRVDDDIFGREAAILAQLDHPNIVKFFCCSNDPEVGECFIAMELMEMSLNSLIESRGKARRPFPLLLVLDIMTQIARGVYYLHGLKIAHRDLKPLNVVVTESRAAHLEDCFCVKLVDFGMSKTKVQVSKSNTISIPGVGTTKYRAPEVFPQAQRAARGQKKKVNWFQADAYSFSITCAVLLSLETPFEDVPASKLYEDLLQGVRPELPGDCPESLVALLNDCWATNPQSRPGFAEICSTLELCKLQELLRVSSEGLQGLAGSEYIETVSEKQSDEQCPCATRVPHVQSQCAIVVSFDSDDVKHFQPLDHVRRQLEIISRILFSMANRADQTTICRTQSAYLVEKIQYQVSRLCPWFSEGAAELRLDLPHTTLNWDPVMFLLDRYICSMVAAEDLLSTCAEEDWMTAAFSVFLPAYSKFAIVTRDLDCASNMLLKLLKAAVDPKCSRPNKKAETKWTWRSISHLISSRQLIAQELQPEDDSSDAQIMTDNLVSDRNEVLTKLESVPRERSLELEVYESVLRKRLGAHVISDVSGLVPDSFWIPEMPPYVFQDVAGTGTSKTVLKCVWLEHQVAIAVYLGEYAKSDLEAEARILARVQHPNVVTFIGCAYEDMNQKGYLVTELMEQDLGQLIRKSRRGQGERPFSLSVSMDIILQIVEAMIHVRKCRVLHRDLKPQNCLVNMKKSGVQEDVGHIYYAVKLIDFGSSKLQGPDMSIAHTRKQGSTAYMAPEVHAMKDACQYTWSADVYSFGMTFYEIISGQYPFEGKCHGRELADRVCAGVRPLFPESCPMVWKQLIEKCWHQNPKRRPTFSLIRKELTECCGKLFEK